MIRKVARVSASLTPSGWRPALVECGHISECEPDTAVDDKVNCKACQREKAIDPLRVAWGEVSFEDVRLDRCFRQRDRREFFKRLVFAARHSVEYPATRVGREIKAWFMAAIVNATDEEKIALDAELGAPVGPQRAGGGA